MAKHPTLRTLAIFYWARVRAQPMRELLALLGIAAGVALLFAVQISNKSITGSTEQLAHSIAGKATLEVAARGPEDFSQSLVRKIERLPSVEGAAPVIERRVAAAGPKGRRALTLFGVDDRLAKIGGPLVRQAMRKDRAFARLGLQLPAPLAKAIGVGPGQALNLEVGERTVRTPLADVLSQDALGPVAQSPVAVAPLGFAQDVARMQGRVTRVLVAPKPGRKAKTEAALAKLAADRLDVRPSDTEAKLLYGAAFADRQSSNFWSAIAVFVGILLAYNAMLLTVDERRAIVATLRLMGAGRRAILASLIFEALALSLAASLVGLVLGDQLSRHLLRTVPETLASAFPIGGQRIVSLQTVAITALAGTLAGLAAAARPAYDLFEAGPLAAVSSSEIDAPRSRSLGGRTWLFGGGLAMIAGLTVLGILAPETIVIGAGATAVGMVMLLPTLIAALLSVTRRITRQTGGTISQLALAELAGNATRAMALAATGAVAAYAIVALSGAKHDIERGVHRYVGSFFDNADVWVMPRYRESPFITAPFDEVAVAPRLRALPAAKSVRSFRGGFFDLGGKRRLLLQGHPRADAEQVPPHEIVDGDIDAVNRRLRARGWVALSATVASDLGLKPGDRLAIETPSGMASFQLAATVSNLGWGSGTLTINASEIGRWWKSTQATALEVDLKDGVPVERGRHAIERALGPGSPLTVARPDENVAANDATTAQVLGRLGQIASMVLFATVLATVSAMLAAISQRRRRLSVLMALGMSRGQVYGALAAETGAILMVGCLVGSAVGLYGQWFADRWIRLVLGYPVDFSPALGLALQTIALVTLLAALATAIVARFSLRFSPQASFSPE